MREAMSKKQHTFILSILCESETGYVKKPHTFILSLLLESKKRYVWHLAKVWKYVVFGHSNPEVQNGESKQSMKVTNFFNISYLSFSSESKQSMKVSDFRTCLLSRFESKQSMKVTSFQAYSFSDSKRKQSIESISFFLHSLSQF